jgi:hypothetical protein
MAPLGPDSARAILYKIDAQTHSVVKEVPAAPVHTRDRDRSRRRGRLGDYRRRRRAASFFPVRLELGFVVGPFARMALVRPCLDRCLCAGDRRQTSLTPCQFLEDRHPVPHVRLMRRFGLRHQLRHLGLQLRFDLTRELIRQRAVTAGIGVDLGVIPAPPCPTSAH